MPGLDGHGATTGVSRAIPGPSTVSRGLTSAPAESGRRNGVSGDIGGSTYSTGVSRRSAFARCQSPIGIASYLLVAHSTIRSFQSTLVKVMPTAFQSS